MDAKSAFDVALHHWRRGNELLNFPVAVPLEEQALHVARASAHFGAGNLALALARAQRAGDGDRAGSRAMVVNEEHGHPQEQE
jgi:hypothetical protein